MRLNQRLIAALLSVLLPALAHAQILSPKRGFADTGANYANLQATGAGWYYTWGTGPANPGNFDARFYPMFWNAPSQTAITDVRNTNPDYVLGFNEPERTDQANMSVAAAIQSWTAISNSFTGTSTKLVSPSVADTGGTTGGQQWLANFMSQATAANLKVDAVSFHWYGVSTPDNPAGAASSFLSRVDSYHNSYGKPVFITEFAIHDWGGIYTDAQIIEANRQFLNIVIPGLESRSYVAGYAWYNWFSDSPLYTGGNPLTPTPMGYSYIGAVGTGSTADVGGKSLGEHVAYLTGGTLTMTGSAGTVRYLTALANSSTITGALDWGLNSSGNWVRIQPGATLRKSGANQITFGAGAVSNDGVIEVAQGVLRLSTAMAGTGSINIPSTGDATGSTARLELAGNLFVAHPITFAQRNDPGGSDGIRNVSGNNTLAGPMTITVGGNQARVRSDAGQLTLAGPITTNATTARNLYLQAAGNGIVSGVISDNAANAGGKINLFKEGAGTWTLTAANTYSGATTISGGVLRLDQLSATAIANSAIASYSFDNISASSVINGGTGGSTMNGTLANGAAIVAGGRFGNAVSLASGASVNINNPITNLGNTANWTVSAWVKTTTLGASILTKSTGGWSNGNTVFYLGDGAGPGTGGIPSAVRYAGGFFQGSTSATSVNDNAWHQVTYVNGTGAYAIYVDGVAQSLSSGNSGFANADIGSIVRLGVTTDNVAGDGTVNFNGLLDSVQIYGQTLSPAQISALYQGQNISGLLPSTTDVSIASGATLDLNGTAQQIASLTGPAGSAVTLGNGQLTVNSPTTTQFSGQISGNGGSLVKNGSNTLTLAGANTYTGTTTVNAGSLRVTGSIAASSAVTVNAGAAFDAAATQTLSALTVNSGGTAKVTLGLLRVGNGAGAAPLAIVGAGKLDLGAGALAVDYAPGNEVSALQTVRSQIISGYQNGTGGITSTNAMADASKALGYAQASEVLDIAGAQTGTFLGQTVDATTVLVRYTLAGDTTLDGVVDFNDLVRLAQNYNQDLSTSTDSWWFHGDVTYDGKVDFNDLVKLAQNYNAALPLSPIAGATPEFDRDLAAAFASVPEPAILFATILMASLSRAPRRRRRR
jgi:autotransporter-associated beta strand protein